MMHKVVADRPVGDLLGQPVAALARPAVRLQDVRLDMVREEIRRIALIRPVDRPLRCRRVPRLLMRECPHRLETIVSRQFRRPCGRKAIRLLQHRPRQAKAEMRGVADAQRQQIGRVGVQKLAPDGESLAHRAAPPRGQRRHMALFATGGDSRASLGGGQAGGNDRAMRRVGSPQHQIALEAMPQDKTPDQPTTRRSPGSWCLRGISGNARPRDRTGRPPPRCPWKAPGHARRVASQISCPMHPDDAAYGWIQQRLFDFRTLRRRIDPTA